MNKVLNYDTVYVGVTIPFTPELHRLQAEICNLFLLIPRAELHLTITFLGSTPSSSITPFGNKLKELKTGFEIHKLRPVGIGGAYERDGSLRHIISTDPILYTAFPRVVWVAIQSTGALEEFRGAVRSAVEDLGFNSSHLTPEYFPHVTLGSGGPPGNDWTLWDIHTIPKTVTIRGENTFPEINAGKLHISDMSIHPESLYRIEDYSTKQ